MFEEAFRAMEESGTFEYLLPFGLVFILVFVILGRAKIFGERAGVWNFLISAIVGLLLVRQGDVVEFINAYIPNVSMVIVVFFGILVIAGLFGFGGHNFKGGLMIVFVIVSLIGGIWAFAAATEQGEFEYTIPFIDKDVEITETDAGIAILLAVFFLIVGIAGYRPKKRGAEGFFDMMSKMGDQFAGVPKS